LALLSLACVLLSSCAGKTPGEQIADMPHWMGGEPAGVPPRRGTPEYDAWKAARRGRGAAQNRSDQDGSDQSRSGQIAPLPIAAIAAGGEYVACAHPLPNLLRSSAG
jgi:hypothetical protein